MFIECPQNIAHPIMTHGLESLVAYFVLVRAAQRINNPRVVKIDLRYFNPLPVLRVTPAECYKNGAINVE